jgi:hypothetical protein
MVGLGSINVCADDIDADIPGAMTRRDDELRMGGGEISHCSMMKLRLPPNER